MSEKKYLKNINRPDVVAYASNPSTCKAGRAEFKASLVYYGDPFSKK